MAKPSDPRQGTRRTDAAANTNKAYAADWAHFSRWCRRRGAAPLPPSAELIGHYLTELAAPPGSGRALSVATIDRRVSGLAAQYADRGFALDRTDPHIAGPLAEIRRHHTRAPARKTAITRDDIEAMVATLPHDLRGLRDRAILLLGFAGGLRRSEIVSLDAKRHPETNGWVEISDANARLSLRAKTGWRQIEIRRATPKETCPVGALDHWMHFARIATGPLFVRTSRDGNRALAAARLSDKHVARLIKSTVLKSGIRADLPEPERLALFSGQSLRMGRAASIARDQDAPGQIEPSGQSEHP